MVNLLPHPTFRDPSVSPPGPTTARPLPQEVVEQNRELVNKQGPQLFDAPASAILEWAHDHAPRSVGGHLVYGEHGAGRVGASVSARRGFLFLDTGYHFPETLDVAAQVERRYPNHQLVRATAQLTRTEQDEVYGPSLYLREPGACCRMRKVEPLAVHMSPYVGWVTGVRRADGPTRANAPALSLDATGRLKISPLVTWSLDDTAAFEQNNDLIVHPLTRQGYPSIGCATCTQPVVEGQDPRAGRWAFAAKTECGLHE